MLELFPQTEKCNRITTTRTRDLNDMAVWPEGHRAGLRAAAPALTLLTPVLAALCGVTRRTVRKQGETTMNSITRNEDKDSTYFHCPSANFNVMLAFSFLPFWQQSTAPVIHSENKNQEFFTLKKILKYLDEMPWSEISFKITQATGSEQVGYRQPWVAGGRSWLTGTAQWSRAHGLRDYVLFSPCVFKITM